MPCVRTSASWNCVPSARGGSRSRSAPSSDRSPWPSRFARSSRTAASPAASGAAAAAAGPRVERLSRPSSTLAGNRCERRRRAPAAVARRRKRARPASDVSMPSNMSFGATPCSPMTLSFSRYVRDAATRPAAAAAATCPGTCACCALRGRSRRKCARAADRIRTALTRQQIRAGGAAGLPGAAEAVRAVKRAWPATGAALPDLLRVRAGSAAARNASSVSRAEAW